MKKYIGPILMLITTFFYTLSHSLVKELSLVFPAQQLAFFRFLVAPLFFLPVLLLIKFPIKIHNWRLIAMRTGFGVSAMLCYFFAVQLGNVGQATLIFQSSTIWTYILAAFILKEFPSVQTKWSIPIAFIGLFLVINPSFSEPLTAAAGLALLGSILNAGVSLSLKKLRDNHDAQSIMITNYTLSSIILSGPALTTVSLTNFVQYWPLLMLMGCIGFFGNWIMTIGFKYTSSGVASAILLLLVPMMYIVGVVFFDEVITTQALVGTTLVFSALIVIAKYQ